MDTYVVKYHVLGGSYGDKVVKASSPSEAKQIVKSAVEHQNPNRQVEIIEIKKR